MDSPCAAFLRDRNVEGEGSGETTVLQPAAACGPAVDSDEVLGRRALVVPDWILVRRDDRSSRGSPKTVTGSVHVYWSKSGPHVRE